MTHQDPPVDLVPTLLAVGEPLLLLPTAQAKWPNIPNCSHQEVFYLLQQVNSSSEKETILKDLVPQFDPYPHFMLFFNERKSIFWGLGSILPQSPLFRILPDPPTCVNLLMECSAFKDWANFTTWIIMFLMFCLFKAPDFLFIFEQWSIIKSEY